MTATAVDRVARPWLAPVAAAVAGAGALAYVALRDPSTQGGFVPCPFHAATGLWCPGCGMTRAVHALTNADVPAALGFNLFAPLLVGVVVWAWLSWFVPAVGGRRLPALTAVPRPVWFVLGAVFVAFAVARNLPVDPLRALAP